MKSLKLIMVLAMLGISQMAIAQTALVKGVLKDAQTQEGITYATVHVFRSDNMEKPVAMSVADENGNIRQEVKGTGKFVAQFSSLGKQTVRKEFTLTGEKEIDLGVILTKDDSQTLGEVNIVAQKPLVKMETDKMTYSVENDVDSKTSTVLDMLRKVPMVTVDGQDNITVNGSSSFKVYVNGKPNPMLSQYASIAFKQMPASMVKNIEVITNPGARYDAEGTGGVLNLTMQTMGGGQAQKMNGISGQAQLMAAPQGFGAGITLTGQQGKWSYNSRIFGNYMEIKDMVVEGNREQFTSAGTSVIDYQQKGRHMQKFLMASFGAGYEIDSMSSMNANLSIMSGKNRDNGHPSTTYSGGIYGNGFSYSNAMKQTNLWKSVDASIDYQRFLNKERTRSITAIYQFSHEPNETNNWTLFDEAYTLPIDLTSRWSFDHDKTDNHTLQVDYVTPVGKEQTLSVGTKFISRRSKTDSEYYLDENGEFVYNPLLSMKYKFINHIAAAYSEYEGKFGKFGTKAGLRYEHTWQDVSYELGNGEDFKKNYGSLVPSGSLSYSIAPTTNIGLTYNMRISRPSISYLNPYVDRSQPTSISYGNTDLDVEKTHTAGITFNHFSSKWMMNATLRQSFCNNAIEQYSFYDDNILNTTYGNIVKRRQTSLNIFMNWSLTIATRIIFNGGVNYLDLRSDALDTRNNGWTANSMIGIQQKLPAKMNFSLYLVNRTKSKTLQGWSSGFNMMNATLNKSFFKDKLTVGITGVTGLGNGGDLAFDSYSQGSNFKNHQRVRIPIQTVMLNVSFSFGNLKQTAKQQKKIEDDFMEKENNNQNMMNNMGIGM